MAALRSRCGHYIFAMWFLLLSSSFFFSSPNLSGRRVDVYFYTWCGPSANLERRSEMCCTRLAGNTGRKNDAQNRHLGTIAQICRAESSQLRHVSTIGKNLVKQQYVAPHIATIWRTLATIGGDRFESLGHPSNFQRLARLGSVTARHSGSGRQPDFAALNRGRHLYSAGRPSRWALAHILVVLRFV